MLALRGSEKLRLITSAKRSKICWRLLLSRSFSSTNVQNDKIYELRTYSVYPHKMAEYLKLTKDEFHLRTAESPLLAYWTAEIGGLNQVVHIWPYESLSHRAEVRTNLSKNSDWISRYVSKVGSMWSQQENSLITPLLKDSSHLSIPQEGVFEIENLDMKSSSGYVNSLKEYIDGISSEDSSLLGSWKSLLGPANRVTLLRHYDTPDGCLEERLKRDSCQKYSAFSDHVASSHSKLLLPFCVSLWK